MEKEGSVSVVGLELAATVTEQGREVSVVGQEGMARLMGGKSYLAFQAAVRSCHE